MNGWFSESYQSRVKRDKNTLGVIVGQQGIGKSYHALRLAEELDPEFTVESVVFEPKDYLNLVEKDSPGRIRIWDEPGLGLGHRDFMSNMNKVIIGELQSFRFKKQDTFFCLPIGSLLDSVAFKISHILLVMKDRGWSSVHTIEPNYYGKNPPYRTPKKGEIYTGMPSKKLIDAYEAKRRAWHDRWVETQLTRIDGEVKKEAKEDALQIVLANPQPYIGVDGKLSAKKLMGAFKLSQRKSYDLKTHGDYELDKNQSITVKE